MTRRGERAGWFDPASTLRAKTALLVDRHAEYVLQARRAPGEVPMRARASCRTSTASPPLRLRRAGDLDRARQYHCRTAARDREAFFGHVVRSAEVRKRMAESLAPARQAVRAQDLEVAAGDVTSGQEPLQRASRTAPSTLERSAAQPRRGHRAGGRHQDRRVLRLHRARRA